MFAALAVGAVDASITFRAALTRPDARAGVATRDDEAHFPYLKTRTEMGGGLDPTPCGCRALVVALRPQCGPASRAPRADASPPHRWSCRSRSLDGMRALLVIRTDVSAARTETLRLVFSIGTFALVPFFVRDRASLRWTLYALVCAPPPLSITAIYQEITGTFFWNAGLGLYGERRINATFADPNHFARFLLEAIVVALMLWCFVERRARIALLAPAIALSMLALVFTGSRGAWVVALVVLPVAVMALPIERRLRLRALAIGGAAVLAVSAPRSPPSAPTSRSE